MTTDELLQLNFYRPDGQNLKAQKLSTLSFWHYTTYETATHILKAGPTIKDPSILKAGPTIKGPTIKDPSTLENENPQAGFWLSRVSDTNDPDETGITEGEVPDSKLHTEAQRKYVLCFSNQQNEQLPSWHLYSGFLGEGVALKLKPTAMKEWLDSIDKVYLIRKDAAPDPVDLRPGECKSGLKFEVGWVFYYKRLTNPSQVASFRCKYAPNSTGGLDLNRWIKDDNTYFTNREFDEFVKKIEGFKKAGQWLYENEFRFLITKTSDYKGPDFDHVEIRIDKNLLEAHFSKQAGTKHGLKDGAPKFGVPWKKSTLRLTNMLTSPSKRMSLMENLSILFKDGDEDDEAKNEELFQAACRSLSEVKEKHKLKWPEAWE